MTRDSDKKVLMILESCFPTEGGGGAEGQVDERMVRGARPHPRRIEAHRDAGRPQHVRRIIAQRRLRRRSEHRRVVDHGLEASQPLRGRDQVSAMAGVGDVSGNGDDDVTELGGHGLERGGPA
ncbi:MAG: hypothetical protein KY410_04670, partial [Proteobacteria bacterium]|nr:hypothetical protein [Pseudomonadota bacterium]